MAEELVFDEMSAESQHDLQHATADTRFMISEYGVSDRLGPATDEAPSASVPPRELYFHENLQQNNGNPDRSGNSSVMENTRQRVRKVLSERRKVADILAHVV